MTEARETVPPEDTFELVQLAGGIRSLRSRLNGQTFHPGIGPVAEARTIHVTGTRLVERADAQRDTPFVVWDVGLGAAANALTAIAALVGGLAPRSADVLLHSFDRTLAPLDFALTHSEALAYPRGYESVLRALQATLAATVPLPSCDPSQPCAVSWQLHRQDFPTILRNPDAPLPAPHAIFYDPYSPTANPEMWTLETLAALRARLRMETPCLLTTYTRSTAVRVTLLLAGFQVGLGGAAGEKDETTVATNVPALLDSPLTRHWLDNKVAASTNAAPLRATASARPPTPIGAADYALLQALPQFQAA